MKSLDQKILRKFLNLAGVRLKGDWVLIGGTVLPLLGVDHRITVDIDLVSLGKSSQGEMLEIMKLAADLGLPVETINSAGSYFFAKVPHSETDLVLLHQGKWARIFRPGATLFLILKVARMSESDFLDCIEWIKRMKTLKEPIDAKRVALAIKMSLGDRECSEAKAKRLRALEKLF